MAIHGCISSPCPVCHPEAFTKVPPALYRHEPQQRETDDHDFLASDGGAPMIYKRNPPRCDHTETHCESSRELDRQPCCDHCNH